ncbi:MAG: hypothetical protein AB7E66_06865, partial [Parvibaculaceae bacterium]
MASTETLRTNRDLYVAIVTLVEGRENEEPELEAYLRSLLGVLERWREQSSLSPSHFVQCLSDAYLAP